MRYAGIRIAAFALTVVAILASEVAGMPVLLTLVLAAAAVAQVLFPLLLLRPGRAALLLAALTLVVGTVATSIRVADGVADSRVQFRGTLDADEILRAMHPSGGNDPLPRIQDLGYGYLSGGEGVMTAPHARAGLFLLWSIAEMAPWLLGLLVFALAVPIVRAAERDEPFWHGATRRLGAIGVVVLVGVPGIALLDYVVADAATAGTFAAPVVAPVFSLSVAHVLPGLLVLVLARVFRRGAALTH